MRQVKYRAIHFRHEYNLLPLIFKYTRSKIIGNSLKQQALNGRMTRKVI